MHAKAELLVQAHLNHLLQDIREFATIDAEASAFIDWIGTQPLSSLMSLELLQRLAEQQLLALSATDALRQEVITVIQHGLANAVCEKTTLADLTPEHSPELIVKAIAGQKQLREKIVHAFFADPTTAEVLSQTIQQTITDYMENNVIAKKVPGVSGLMKLGKGMIEKATDSNLDDALQFYLKKNISGIMASSEKLTNRHLTEQRIEQTLLRLWAKNKSQPISAIRPYATPQILQLGSQLTHQSWEHLRHTPFVRTQLLQGLEGWYLRNANRSVQNLLADIHITPELIRTELRAVVEPVLQLMLNEGYLRQRIEGLLRRFYGSAEVSTILEG